MMTILPQNSNLARVNTVTVDAEKFARLNGIADMELREALGTVLAKLVKSYNNNVINFQKYTLGQALEVIEMAADEVRAFTGVDPQTVDEYEPTHFTPIEESPVVAGLKTREEKPVKSAEERQKMLFDSFIHKR